MPPVVVAWSAEPDAVVGLATRLTAEQADDPRPVRGPIEEQSLGRLRKHLPRSLGRQVVFIEAMLAAALVVDVEEPAAVRSPAHRQIGRHVPNVVALRLEQRFGLRVRPVRVFVAQPARVNHRQLLKRYRRDHMNTQPSTDTTQEARWRLWLLLAGMGIVPVLLIELLRPFAERALCTWPRYRSR